MKKPWVPPFLASFARSGEVLAVVQFPEEQLRRRCPNRPRTPRLVILEARAFCGPKDLCNLPLLRRCRQIAQVLRFAQDDKPYLGELHRY